MKLSTHKRRKIIKELNKSLSYWHRFSSQIKQIDIKIEKYKWNYKRKTYRYLVLKNNYYGDFNCGIFFFKYQRKAIKEYLSTKFKCPIEICPIETHDLRKSRKQINEEKEKLER